MLPCVYKQSFGIECPSCGVQRAACLWWEGQWESAFWQYPPLIPWVVLVFACGRLWMHPTPGLAAFCRYWAIGTGILMGIHYIYHITKTLL